MDLGPLLKVDRLDDSWPLSLHAPFTTAMAASVGVLPHDLRRLVRHCYLRHVLHGVYVASQRPDSTALRCEALALVVPAACVVVDRHAGWLLGAEMVLAPDEHIALRPISVFRPSGHGRLRNGLAVSGERNLSVSDVTEVDGIAVTTPLRTAWDLGRVRYTDRAIAGLDAVLRLGAFTLDELLDGVERFRGMRWVTTLRAVAPLADGRAASPGESVLRLRWVEALLPTPHPQLEVRVGSHLLGILDLANEALRYAAEYDGREWHGTEAQQAHDRLRRRAISDQGWVVDPFVAEDLFGPRTDPIARLRRGAAEARRLHAGHAA